jgi:SWIM zinc finger
VAIRAGTDVWRLAPVDSPGEPRKGMYFWVQTGDHWAIGERYTISRVNNQSFYVSVDGRKERIDLRRWREWLRERSEEGYVVLDGHPLRDPLDEPFAMGVNVPVTGAATSPDRDDSEEKIHNSRGIRMNANLRDARLLRAVRDVMKRYSFSRTTSAEGEIIEVEVSRRGASYTVAIDPTWRRPPSCTCPDADRIRDASGATFCKHAIAALLSDDEHRHQLIDLLL